MNHKLIFLIIPLLVTNIVTFAQSSKPKFNSDDRDLPTVLISNVSQNREPCEAGPGIGCWERSIIAKAGDTVAVSIYFHNSTIYKAENTVVWIKPRSDAKDKFHIFIGGVLSPSIERAEGFATIALNIEESITYIPGSVRLYKHGETAGYSISNEELLFGNAGIDIGTIAPGWDTQGTLVAQFLVSRE